MKETFHQAIQLPIWHFKNVFFVLFFVTERDVNLCLSLPKDWLG